MSTGLSTVYAGSMKRQTLLLTEKNNLSNEPYSYEEKSDKVHDGIDVLDKSELGSCGSPQVDFLGQHQEDRYRSFNNILPRRESIVIDNETWDIIVPDNYSSIQEAVDNAGPQNGYRIFVRAGMYREHIIIGTNAIVLHGENKEDTVIDASYDGDVVQVRCNYVLISGFTIKNGGTGCSLNRSSGNLLIDNLITSNHYGVRIDNHSHANNVTLNRIEENNDGVVLSTYSSGNQIIDNSITGHQGCGVAIDGISRGNIVIWNQLSHNKVGVNCSGISNGNLLYLNSFIENDLNAFDASDDRWDDGTVGNYWSDYTGADSNNDGIGDTPYLIRGGENLDRYPLMHQVLPKSSSPVVQIRQFQSIEPYRYSSFSSSSFPGDVIIVPDDYPTIQGAVDHAVDGDTIMVRAGVYNEHVVVDKQLKIEGDGTNVTIVDGQDRDDNVISLEADGIEITALTMRNCSAGFSGVRIYGDNCLVHHALLVGCGGGVELWSTQNTLVHNTTFTNCIWGVYVTGSDACMMRDNLFMENVYGFEVGFSSVDILSNTIMNTSLLGVLGIGVHDGAIKGNSISSVGDIGIQMFSSNGIDIHENVFRDDPAGISLFKSSDNVMDNNNVYQNSKAGISLWYHSDGNVIEDNVIERNVSEYARFLRYYRFLASIYPLLWVPGISNLFDIQWYVSNLVKFFPTAALLKLNETFTMEPVGISLELSDNNTISRNTISNLYSHYHTGGILTRYVNNNIITENIIQNTIAFWNDGGITCDSGDTSHNVITDNSVINTIALDAGVYGITCYGGSSIVSGNSVRYTEALTNGVWETSGIWVDGDDSITVCDNIVANTIGGRVMTVGIVVSGLHNNDIVRNNTITNTRGKENAYGIFAIGGVTRSKYLVFDNNTVIDTEGWGIYLMACALGVISGNIVKNSYGDFGVSIYIMDLIRCVIKENTIAESTFENIVLGRSSSNIIYHNNYKDTIQNQNAYDDGTNTWDDGYPSGGNYWDDYQGIDADGDGIGDTPYTISGGDNLDRYPLMEPYTD